MFLSKKVCGKHVSASLVEPFTNVTSGAPAQICCGCRAGFTDVT